MIKIAVFIIISLYFQGIEGSIGSPPPQYDWCPSGIIGPACSDYQPCDPGYTCEKKTNLCCKNLGCPLGWFKGGSCSLINGQKTCPEGYMCMPNDFCCRSTVCPSGSIGSACVVQNQCHAGYKCRGGYCCNHPRCPVGWLEGDSVCNLTPGQVRCPSGFDCINDFCCKKNPNYCPPEKIGGKCPNGKCQYGYDCKNGYCCQNY
ncbi:uncharacterized protein K04H4.2-like [Ruditapes philippinarum]|uniref:uncharacterized protein K04H4.2-like n=1 Tax=Ruditapes philippinarum TaxID=129788 RepID=UPI00295B3E29|nr:uncharacterized protein K04H4.2-like [Ruditapes philippinarum]